MTRPFSALLGLSILGPVLLAARAPQQAPGTPAAPQEPTPALTLHAASRIVLADLTVTDRHGNPVHGLTADDFKVFDDGKPQRIASFEEHTDSSNASYTTPTPTPGTVTNSFQNLPPILNVVLIDTTNLELPDQMFLHIQLTKFLNALPASQPIAIFDRHGDYTVLLQPFTADRALLQAAVNRAVPRIPLGAREYRTDTDTLRQIGAYLAQIPGRKNVLWFSGGSTAFMMYGLSALTTGVSTGPAPNSAGAAAAASASAPATPIQAATGDDPDELRQVYDELEAVRIAIYPIDARGLSTEGDVAMGPEQTQMIQSAESTGGQAYFNSNGLAAVATHILSTDSSAYTLTYSPQDFKYDGKWHTIRIEARRPDLRLSYRRGYFADQTQPASKSRKLNTLFAGDSSPVAAPDLRSSPLIFEASVHPLANPPAQASTFIPLRPLAPASRGTTAFAIDYSMSTTGLSSATIDGASRATVVFVALALDRDGNRIGQSADRVRFPLPPNSPPRKLDVQQQIDLPKGSGFVALTVWDPASGHLGMLQVPVTVGKSK